MLGFLQGCGNLKVELNGKKSARNVMKLFFNGSGSINVMNNIASIHYFHHAKSLLKKGRA